MALTEFIYGLLALIGAAAGLFVWGGRMIKKAEQRGKQEHAQRQQQKAQENAKIAQDNRAKNVADVSSGKRRRLFESDDRTDEQ